MRRDLVAGVQIGLVIPGFRDFNDILYDEGSLELPHAVRDELRFDNAVGKALFSVHGIEPPQLPDGCFAAGIGAFHPWRPNG